MGADRARPAYVEDVDGDSDNNRTVRGTRVSATSSGKDKKRSRESRSTKEKKSRGDNGYASLAVPTKANESATIERVRVIPDREVREGRHKSASAASAKSPRKSSRPPLAQRVTFDHVDLPSRPKNRDDPRYFGERDGHPVVIQTNPTPRPPVSSAPSQRPPRPISFQGPPPPYNRPPLSQSAYYQPVYGSPIMTQPSYPNPMQASYFPPQAPASPSRSSLKDRFGRTGAIVRPSSAAGYRTSDLHLMDRNSEYEYESAEEEPSRTDLMHAARRRIKELEDAAAMPPPQMHRRGSVRPSLEQSPFFEDNRDDDGRQVRDFDQHSEDYDDRPLRQRSSQDYGDRPLRQRSSQDYGDRPPRPRPSQDYDDRPSRQRPSQDYDDRPARPKIMYRESAPAPRPRRQSLPRAPPSTESLSFDYDKANANIRVETRDGRRNSYYDGVSPQSSNYEEKVRDAAGYQNEVSGGEPIKLTADLLRKQQHTIASSRSTRSSGSRDESDFNKRSVTTRTTRSGSGPDDDVTIRIKGNATVNIAGAEITNADGVELNIVNRRKSLRNGSEASRSEYAPSQAVSSHAPSAADERRGRYGRGTNHARSASQSVKSRGYF